MSQEIYDFDSIKAKFVAAVIAYINDAGFFRKNSLWGSTGVERATQFLLEFNKAGTIQDFKEIMNKNKYLSYWY